MSVKLELYQLIKSKIEAIPSVKTFGKYNNQFDTEQQEQPFNNPAVFFSFEPLAWFPASTAHVNSNATQQQKTETCLFTLRISYWSHKPESDKYEELLALVDEVYRAVASAESENINPIQRINEEDDADHTEPIVWTCTFATMLTEPGVDNNTTGVTVTPIIQT